MALHDRQGAVARIVVDHADLGDAVCLAKAGQTVVDGRRAFVADHDGGNIVVASVFVAHHSNSLRCACNGSLPA